MQELTPLIYDLAIMLGVAGAVTLVFQRIRQPVVLGYLVAGMIIGPYTPPFSFITNEADIKTLSELGVIFLMFSLGIEFSFHKLIRVGFSASVTGLIEVGLMLLIGYGVGVLLGWPHYDSLFLGAALSISSTTIIIKAIDELKLKSKRFAEVIFGVLIAEDLLAILLLVALSRIVVTQDALSFDMLFTAIELFVIVASWFVIGYFLVPPLFREIAKFISDETLIIVSVALCLALVVLAGYLHYSTALGAFIMGSILAETVLARKIETLIMPIRNVFGAVFFISVGMLIDPNIIVEQWMVVILISLITISGKIFTTGFGVMLAGHSAATAVRVGFSMAQIGEFSFIIVGLGAALGVIGNSLYPVIVAVSAITTFTTPYLIRYSGALSSHVESVLPKYIRLLLADYAAWFGNNKGVAGKHSSLHHVWIRFLINSILVAIIFTLIDRYITPSLLLMTNNTMATYLGGLILAAACSSPFIWGMLFSYKMSSSKKSAESQFSPVVFIIWFITFIEISLFSLLYFPTWMTGIFILVLSFVFMVGAYKHLEKSYAWFEKQFINNINLGEREVHKFKELGPWATQLEEIIVPDGSPLAGKTLDESQLRQHFGINVVAIVHDNQVVLSPRGKERILSHDRLIVLANEEKIEAFSDYVNSSQAREIDTNLLGAFVLKTILIGKDHPYIGKTIRQSMIREKVNGVVVGLERKHSHMLNPELDIVIEENDLLFVVAESSKLSEL